MSKELRRVEEDSLYSEKGHFSAATRWNNLMLWLGAPAAVMAGVSGVSALSKFDNHDIVAGVLALLVAGLTALTTFLNPSDRATTHHAFGNRYNSLRNRARITAEVDAPTIAIGKLRTTVDSYAAERDDLNAKAPQIPPWAFKKARKDIEGGEADYAVDSPPTNET